MDQMLWAHGQILNGRSKTEVAEALGLPRKTFADRYEKWLALSDYSGLQTIFDQARTNQRSMSQLDPVITKLKTDIVTDDPISVAFVSCLHLGSRWSDYTLIQKFIQVSRHWRIGWVLMGDDVDGYEDFNDVATRSEQALPHPLQQRDLLAKVVDYLQEDGLIIAAYAGQHGAQWQRRNTGVDPLKELYRSRNIPYFDGQGLISLRLLSPTYSSEQTYKIFGAHKLPKRDASDPLSAQRKAAKGPARDADIIVGGDSHQFAIAGQFSSLHSGDRWQWLAQSGTFKTGDDPYTIRSYTNGQYGIPIFAFSPTKYRIEWVKDIDVLPAILNSIR